MQAAVRIIGIDPGLRTTGWGVIESCGADIAYIGSGGIRPDERKPVAERLRELHEHLAAVIREYRPDEAAVEETFINRNPQSALKLGQARAIALVVPALAGITVAEYAANLIKKTLTGTGHAEKTQIAMMASMLLPGSGLQRSDAADALAVAITHARVRLWARNLESAGDLIHKGGGVEQKF
jgi:crossover junction endodeoxyribonuclease RuvC